MAIMVDLKHSGPVNIGQRGKTRSLSLFVSCSTTPPPGVRIINGYVTVEPPLKHQGHHRRSEVHSTEQQQQQPSSPSSQLPGANSARPLAVRVALALSCISAWLLTHMLLLSWPRDSHKRRVGEKHLVTQTATKAKGEDRTAGQDAVISSCLSLEASG